MTPVSTGSSGVHPHCEIRTHAHTKMRSNTVVRHHFHFDHLHSETMGDGVKEMGVTGK